MVKWIKKRLKPGMRAGMNRAKICMKARELWSKDGDKEFTVRGLAKALDVAPATVQSHFRGGINEILSELAHVVLSELAPPYKPLQQPQDYLQVLLEDTLATFRQQPRLGVLVMRHLANDPLSSPIFAERICATLKAISPDHDLALAYEVFLRRFIGFVATETGDWLGLPVEDIAPMVGAKISSLPTVEVPTLAGSGESLAARMAERVATSLEEVAAAARKGLIEDLANYAKAKPPIVSSL
jgi:AcrR family transcriptional regulator